MSWFSRLLGLDDQTALMREMLRVSQAQVEVNAQMSHTMAHWMAMFQVVEAPERRPTMDDAMESALYEAYEEEAAKFGPP